MIPTGDPWPSCRVRPPAASADLRHFHSRRRTPILRIVTSTGTHRTREASGELPRGSAYLDGFATTAIAPEARDAMIEALTLPANPSSPHGLGERAAGLVDRARAEVASLAGCAPAEIVFTSGATEADNLAITGIARSSDGRRRRIVVSAVEHRAVLEPATALSGEGFEIIHAPVDRRGVIDLERLPGVIGDACLLVSVMAVNNETGVVQPIAEIARIAHSLGALVHTDAAQALGKIPVALAAWDVDYASVTAHKMHGPVGVGALYVAAGSPAPRALQLGGGQQAGRRAGTEPVALIAAFGAAAAVARRQLEEDARLRASLLSQFLDELSKNQVRWEPVSGNAETVPGGCSIVLPDIDADELCQRIQDSVFLSTSSACSSGQIDVSHVLKAMGLSKQNSDSTIRLMTSRYSTPEEMEVAATRFAEAIGRMRATREAPLDEPSSALLAFGNEAGALQ